MGKFERGINAQYAALTPPERTEALAGIQDAFAVAGRHDVSLKPRHATAILAGRDQTPSWKFIKRRKLKKIEQARQEEALHATHEQQEQKCLTQWLETDTVQLELAWAKTGKELLQAPVLFKTGQEGPDAAFSLDKLLSLPYESIAGRLTPDDVQALQGRERFWRRYGITTGEELHDFLNSKKNFKRKKVEFDKEDKKLPVELRWLKASAPEDFIFLQELATNQDYGVELVKSIKAPDEVGESIRSIAAAVYRGYVSPWFESFTHKDQDPVMLDSDRELLEGARIVQKAFVDRVTRQADTKLRRRLHIAPQPLVADVKDAIIDEEHEKRLAHEESLALIRDYLPLMISLDISHNSGRHIPLEIRQRIQAINDKLTNGLGKDYALKRLQFEDSQNISEKSRELLAWTLVIIAVSTGLESFHEGVTKSIAKGVAAESDDIVSELAAATAGASAEGKSTLEFLKERAPKLVFPFLLATGLAFTVENVRKFGGDRWGGFTFMTAATMLSGFTVLLSGWNLGKSYEALAKEGKLENYYAVVPAEHLEEIKQGLHEADASLTPQEGIWKGIEAYLRDHRANDHTIEQQRVLFGRFAEGKEVQEIFDHMKDPSWYSRFGHGLKEATVINPSGGFILTAATLAPVVGYFLGPLFLPHPAAYAIAGGFEGQTGIAGAAAYKGLFDRSWRRHVEREIPAIKQDPPVDSFVQGGDPVLAALHVAHEKKLTGHNRRLMGFN